MALVDTTTMTQSYVDLRNLSETEVKGRVLRWEGTRGGKAMCIRWKIVGFCRKRVSARYAQDRTGQVGNLYMIVERLDSGSKAEPRGTRKVMSKGVTWFQYVIEPIADSEQSSTP